MMDTDTMFFGDLAPLLADRGYEPIPIIPGEKRPRPKGWEQGGFAKRVADYPRDYVGLLTRDTPAVDIDVSDETLVRQIEAIVLDVLDCHERPPPARVGMAPRRLLAFRTCEPFGKLQTSEYALPTDPTIGGKIKHSRVEILADGQQFVAFAVHPATGKPYAWNGIGNPLTVPQRDLVNLDLPQAVEIITRCEALLAKHGRRVGGDGPAAGDGPRVEVSPQTIVDLRSALNIMDANDRDVWVANAHRLSKLGTVGRELWFTWAQQSEKFEPIDAARVWKSAKPDHTGYQAVFSTAQALGWVNPASKAAASTPAGARDVGNDDWPEPTTLPEELPAVEAFDPDLLPAALRGWIVDISYRMQCPPDFSAVAAVAAVSSLVGARAVVRPKAHDDWTVVPNLWALAIGRPGVMKSPAISEVLRPLHRLQADERKRWDAAMQEWELDAKVAELDCAEREKQAKKVVGADKAKARRLLKPDDDAKVAPIKREFIVNDATVEAFQEVLAVNPWGTLAYRDEIYGLLTGLDKQGQEGSRSFYLTGYDGDKGHTTLRIVRGETYIKRVCIAMLGGIQPARIQSYVRGAVEGGAADDGLLQRFGLAVWPDVAPEFTYVDQWPDNSNRQQADAVFARLAQLQPTVGGEFHLNDEPQVWKFSPEAQQIFFEWYTASRQELKRGELHPAMESHLSKYAKLIPALALIFALIDTPDSGRVIQVHELLRALAWGHYLRSHAERLYSAATKPETSGARALLNKISKGKVADGDGVILDRFTPRQIAVKHWAGLASVDDVRKAADLLVDFGWLRHEVTPVGATGGRPSELYVVNPAALQRAGEPS